MSAPENGMCPNAPGLPWATDGTGGSLNTTGAGRPVNGSTGIVPSALGEGVAPLGTDATGEVTPAVIGVPGAAAVVTGALVGVVVGVLVGVVPTPDSGNAALVVPSGRTPRQHVGVADDAFTVGLADVATEADTGADPLLADSFGGCTAEPLATGEAATVAMVGGDGA